MEIYDLVKNYPDVILGVKGSELLKAVEHAVMLTLKEIKDLVTSEKEERYRTIYKRFLVCKF